MIARQPCRGIHAAGQHGHSPAHLQRFSSPGAPASPPAAQCKEAQPGRANASGSRHRGGCHLVGAFAAGRALMCMQVAGHPPVAAVGAGVAQPRRLPCCPAHSHAAHAGMAALPPSSITAADRALLLHRRPGAQRVWPLCAGCRLLHPLHVADPVRSHSHGGVAHWAVATLM